MSDFQFEIITPERTFYSGTVSSLVLPGTNGYFGVLAHHAPLIARSNGGKLKLRNQSGEQYFQIGPGTVEVFRNHVILLTKQAEANLGAQAPQESKN